MKHCKYAYYSITKTNLINKIKMCMHVCKCYKHSLKLCKFWVLLADSQS